jgi:hypothetical protein
MDTIWTGFLKADAEIPDKILRPHTRESLQKIVANKKVCETPHHRPANILGFFGKEKKHSLRVGWRNFFSSCAVLSVFGSGGK